MIAAFCYKCGTKFEGKFCPNCGASLEFNNPPQNGQFYPPQVPPQKKSSSCLIVFLIIALILIALFTLIAVIGISISNSITNENSTQNSPTAQTEIAKTVPSNDDKFSGDCGVKASADMGTSIIGMPTLRIHISNASQKEISAVKFYFVPIDVYGEEITGLFSQNYLYSDSTIPVGASDSFEYDFLEDSIKKGNLYLYSVYFSDGTEWGNRDASRSTILEKGLSVTVNGTSR